MANIIDGKKISADMRGEIAIEVAKLKELGVTAGLAVVIVGEDPASQVYVRNKHKACGDAGMYSIVHTLPENSTQEEVISLVNELNNDDKIHGILVQLPLPKHLDDKEIIEAVSPDKDVDMFHPYNVGKFFIGGGEFRPCTPAGVIELIERSGVDITGKDCVIVGRSNIVGKPQALMILEKNGTPTVCHSRTKNLGDVTKRADILIVAIGRANFVTADMVKEGAVVIDVGMNRNDMGKLCGDVDFDAVKEIASYITPVPGGVGPMTITMLLKNTLIAAKKRLK